MTIYIVSLTSFLGLAVLLNFLYKRTNSYRNRFLDVQKFKSIHNLPDGSLELVVIGSNAPKFAFDFSNAKDIRASNWSIGPETFEYDNIILRKFGNKLRQGAYVVVCVCPLNFFHHKYHPHSDLYKYYGLLNKNEMPDYNAFENIKYHLLPLFFHPIGLVRLVFDAKKNDMMTLRQNRYNQNELKKNADYWVKKVWNPAYGIDIENMGPLSDTNKKDIQGSKRALREIAEYCKNKNLKLMVVYPPMTAELHSKFSDEFIAQYIRQYVKEALQGYQVEEADYTHDSRFFDSKYYIDAFFMNRVGAACFTETFLNEHIRNK